MILSLLLRLRQISVHPQVYISSKKKTTPTYSRPEWTADSTKTDAIVNILRKDTGYHGYVIFCNFKEEMAVLEQRLRREDCVSEVLTYSGEMNSSQRSDTVYESETKMRELETSTLNTLNTTLQNKLNNDVLSRIQDYVGPKHVVLLAQIQCAGTGINLQHMDRIIFTTPWWTAALMDQAAARVLRIGQKRNVVIHHLSLEEEEMQSINIDDYINEKVEFKREMCQMVLNAADHRI